jgi:hypothetical protein
MMMIIIIYLINTSFQTRVHLHLYLLIICQSCILNFCDLALMGKKDYSYLYFIFRVTYWTCFYIGGSRRRLAKRTFKVDLLGYCTLEFMSMKILLVEVWVVVF